jgi:predicted transcriptional regulator
VGKHYTEQEKRRIQELAQQGYTDEAIAQQLGRSTNAIRNIRHRDNIKSSEIQSIHQLKETKQTLEQQTQQTEYELKKLEQRRNQIQRALQMEQTQLNQKLEIELTRLKDTKPELFTITAEEQLIKLTAQLGASILRWLFE